MVYMNNIGKISAVKRNQVLSCIDVAKRYAKIKKMIIFGSAVTDHCLESSDVDICLVINGSTRGREMYELSRDLSWACGHHCDILKYHKLSDMFKAEIDKKGVLVYELS